MTPLQTVMVNALSDSGLTPTEIARKSGYSVSTITALVRGDRAGCMSTWNDLLDVIGVEISYRFKEGNSY